MRTGQAFPSKYVKADDLTKPVTLTIERYAMEVIDERSGEQKPVVYFTGAKRGLVLNVTNASLITSITGTDEMDNWPGHMIQLYRAQTSYQGKMVPCVRVQAVPVQQQAGNGEVQAPAPPAQPLPQTVLDDDIPF